MSENVENVEKDAADDWAAAMAEQTGSAEATAEEPAADNAAPARRAPTAAFEQFSPGPAKAGVNDIDLILDIPVQLTVELGRTKIAIKTCCSSHRVRWSSSMGSQANRWMSS